MQSYRDCSEGWADTFLPLIWYLRSYRASAINSAHSPCSGIVLIQIREGRSSWIASHWSWMIIWNPAETPGHVPSSHRQRTTNSPLPRHLSIRKASHHGKYYLWLARLRLFFTDTKGANSGGVEKKKEKNRNLPILPAPSLRSAVISGGTLGYKTGVGCTATWSKSGAPLKDLTKNLATLNSPSTIQASIL